jgi:arsenite methyltransferase
MTAHAQFSKPQYGIDAPGVIRNLLVIGAACLVAASICPDAVRVGSLDIVGLHSTFRWPGVWLVLTGALMLLYALVGKFKHRDRMVAMYTWRGDERVLDVGTGRGLLLVGAARRLTTGHVVGLDIWNKEDLSGNARELTERNLQIEGVSDRCTLVSESADRMSFKDGEFDVVVSNLCLHNIYNRAARRQACLEIVRVLRPGGTAIISDYRRTHEYTRIFRESGLRVTRHHANWLTTYPPLAVLVATKP